MGWDRLGLLVAIASFFAMVVAPPAWSGGALGTGATASTGASSGPSFLGSGANAGASADGSGQSILGGNVGFTGSLMNATASGQNGASPGENLSDTGAGDATPGYNVSLNYMTERFPVTNAPTKIQAGYTVFNIGGKDPSVYNGGNISGGAQNGNLVSSKLDLKLANVTGDFGLVAGAAGGSSGYGFNAGPRLQWVQYVDSFTFNNSTLSSSTSRDRNFGMFGVGAFGTMAVPGLNKSFGGSYGGFSPGVSVAASVGWGGAMRYTWLEGFLKLYEGSFSESKVAAEIGWIFLQFKENLDDISAGAVTSSNASYSVSIPVIKGGVSF